jgi:hypothetical protein
MLRAIVWALVLLAPLPAAQALQDSKADEPQKNKEAGKTLKVEDQLTAGDPADGGKHRKVHPFKMEAGKTYVIEMHSREGNPKVFDPYLRLEDAGGKVLAQDDDGAGFPNARIVFEAPQAGEYRIVATTFAPGMTGKYTLTVAPGSKSLGVLSELKERFQKDVQALNQEFVAAKTDKEKEQVRARFFEAAAQHAEALAKFLEKNGNDPAAGQARQEMLQSLAMLSGANSPAVAKTLRKMLESTTQKDLKGQLSLTVGQGMRAQAERAYQKKDKAAAEKLMKEAHDLLTTAKEAGGPAAQQATDALYLLEHLSVGKAAPEIEAEDLDGKKFKLSDYRGKVVVLDFWGNW